MSGCQDARFGMMSHAAEHSIFRRRSNHPSSRKYQMNWEYPIPSQILKHPNAYVSVSDTSLAMTPRFPKLQSETKK